MLNFGRLATKETYMQRCLELAALGSGQVAPNPMVGAVLVHNGIVIGEGYHMKYGKAHAEPNCINSVPEALRHLVPESVLYVSLEPCSHFGKTPPCSDLIIQTGIRKVVIACQDPFTQVNGTGIQKLNDAGITTEIGILQDAAKILNRRFFCFHQKERPYIILKWAQTADGKIAGKDRQPLKISNTLSNRLVHKWRSEESAIMVGTNTALMDDPSLTTRLWPGNNPLRIVIDKRLEIPKETNLLDGTVPTIILNQVVQNTDGNTIYYKITETDKIPFVVTRMLKERQLTSILVEGGAVLLQSFIDAGLWDEARVITNLSMKITDGVNAPVLTNYTEKEVLELENDQVSFFANTHI